MFVKVKAKLSKGTDFLISFDSIVNSELSVVFLLAMLYFILECKPFPANESESLSHSLNDHIDS